MLTRVNEKKCNTGKFWAKTRRQLQKTWKWQDQADCSRHEQRLPEMLGHDGRWFSYVSHLLSGQNAEYTLVASQTTSFYSSIIIISSRSRSLFTRFLLHFCHNSDDVQIDAWYGSRSRLTRRWNNATSAGRHLRFDTIRYSLKWKNTKALRKFVWHH